MKIQENLKQRLLKNIEKYKKNKGDLFFEEIFSCISEDEVNYVEKVLQIDMDYEPLTCMNQNYVDTFINVEKSFEGFDYPAALEVVSKLSDEGNIAATFYKG